jgi:hypothetical protein
LTLYTIHGFLLFCKFVLRCETSFSGAFLCFFLCFSFLSLFMQKTDKQAIAHTVGGYSWHSPEVINSLMVSVCEMTDRFFS